MWQTVSVIGIADENSATCFLFLEVTLQAQRLIALGQHSRVHRAVWRMATDAAFTQRLVLKHERTGLGDVTLEARFVLAKQQSSAAFDLLRQAGPAAFDRAADVWIVAIGATHFAFQHRMMVRHFESGAHFKVTLEAGLRRSPRIHDLALIAAG